MTKEHVTDPNTWGYRGLTIPGELEVLQSGKLISKATRAFENVHAKNFEEALGFWSKNGPDLKWLSGGESSVVADALRILATQSTDQPKSQFVSVGLDEKTASSFAKGITVVAFQVVPNSPILGLNNCGVGEDGGEIQFQIAGGTPIRNLHKLDLTKPSLGWQKWDTDKKQWINTHDEL